MSDQNMPTSQDSSRNELDLTGQHLTESDHTSTDLNTSGLRWFRSIPRRIQRFLLKHSRQSKYIKQADAASNEPIRDLYEGIDLPVFIRQLDTSVDDDAMKEACAQMSRYGWYWGPISRQKAQQKLHGMPNGSFLVRNSQVSMNIFTISFRTAGKTLHYRFENLDGYWQPFSSKHETVVELINEAMKQSAKRVFGYVKQNSQLIPPFPVRLTNPISRFGEIRTLQGMCRLVIQKNINDIDNVDMLPLPNKLISYCKIEDKNEVPFNVE